MKQALIALFVAAFGFGLVADAEAKRIGGGRSSGMQRNITPQKPVAPAQGATAAPTAPVPQPSGMSRWLGPVAGLAAGIGLVALLSHLGLGEGFATIVMMLLITLAVFVVIRLLFGRRTPQQSQPLQYAGGGAHPSAAGNVPAAARFDAPPSGGGTAAVPAASGSIPAGFDVDGFLRQAKLNFLRLQAANDAKNIEDIRNFTTPEMFAEIKLEIEERGGGTQQTDVVTLNAELLDVSEELGQYIASVRFHGAIRETENAAPEAFDEAWHLTKPVAGDRGWVIAGIQQFT
ncbi:MAG: Tim44-like domain-containing protein [Rhodocyclaceae bacterium]|jgi:predicted lipid-binding transport protein (Tim44 family)|nr:Tim44 domain-containing protein [Rhodocyclaceae bacterium]MCB1891768.1 Tim44 domain-containing protein [Rhodocyclaceae bacterium]MCW5596873.1 Tim44 domain-containing protein [Rhodocyclaceae bacterium]